MIQNETSVRRIPRAVVTVVAGYAAFAGLFYAIGFRLLSEDVYLAGVGSWLLTMSFVLTRLAMQRRWTELLGSLAAALIVALQWSPARILLAGAAQALSAPGISDSLQAWAAGISKSSEHGELTLPLDLAEKLRTRPGVRVVGQGGHGLDLIFNQYTVRIGRLGTFEVEKFVLVKNGMWIRRYQRG